MRANTKYGTQTPSKVRRKSAARWTGELAAPHNFLGVQSATVPFRRQPGIKKKKKKEIPSEAVVCKRPKCALILCYVFLPFFVVL